MGSSDIIWTNHAKNRLAQRKFPQDLVYKTLERADKKYPAKDGSEEFIRWFGASKVTVIAKRNEHREWILLSCWIDPPLPGTVDAKRLDMYKRYQEATGLKKWILGFLRQLGW